ncbi:Cullin family-domain-containing protein [Polychytrium aggregatum]|uniref:Cullin family-domain-containing protein n=1 Tax=Polychytrium aggregatum TaxID=110093 RepID=UPI0022FF1B15|nr:Cullin family-domain-containing protein [Polychytrium aggregatum]KAI9206906.1 Cullin family-domain-containing protein [Polychytrium aggregatum]
MSHPPAGESKKRKATPGPQSPSDSTDRISLAKKTDAAMLHSSSLVPANPSSQKKMIFKGFSVAPTVPLNYEEATWKKLKIAIDEIQQRRTITDSQEELYRACEDMCHQKMSASLYSRLKEEFNRFVLEQLLQLQSSSTQGSAFLQTVEAVWLHFRDQALAIRGIFLYLDRTYVIQTPGIKSIWDMGLDLFHTALLDHKDLQSKIVETALREIDHERSGINIARSTLRTVIRMYLELGIYTSHFESALLVWTREFYVNEGSAHALAITSGEDTAKYMALINRRLNEEALRCQPSHDLGYLDEATRRTLIAVPESELIEKYAQLIVDKGFDQLMEKRRHDDLKLMYQLLVRVDGLECLKRNFSNYIRSYGTAIISDPSKDTEMVQSLIKYKSEIDDVLSYAFESNDAFFHLIKEAFEKFINTRKNKPAEMIAKYIDELMKPRKGKSDAEVESALDKCLTLFRYIQGKDIFEAFYRAHLAKRLLLGKSASVDAEKSMLGKLRAECGPTFTSNLEGMFKDIEVSRDNMASFKSTKYSDGLGAIDLHVNVLTARCWPTYVPLALTLPPELERCQEVFKEYYISRNKGRKLTWQHTLGHASLKAHFAKGDKELIASTAQAAILLLFNNRSFLTLQEIQDCVGMDAKELSKVLQTLLTSSQRILLKVKSKSDADDREGYKVNDLYENALMRVKINSLQLKDTPEEEEATKERVAADRQYQVDAAIVRIMKTKKRLSHTLLVSAVFEQLKLQIEPADMKKRIESLIEREFLQRDADDNAMYIYLA